MLARLKKKLLKTEFFLIKNKKVWRLKNTFFKKKYYINKK